MFKITIQDNIGLNIIAFDNIYRVAIIIFFMVYISVVIFNYNRTNFIRDVVTSLINDTNNIDVEILVIKSYINEDIDHFLTDKGIKFFNLMDKKNQSDYIKCAVEKSRGDVLVFHDDDDQFTPKKIGYINKIFSENKDLGYYHNNFDTIDEVGNIVKNRNYKTPQFNSLYIKDQEKSMYFNDRIKLLLKVKPDFNSSSIAIRKSIIEIFKENYDFNVRPDTFIMIAGLVSELSLFFDNKVLTHYRIYGNNVSTSYNASISRMRNTFMKAFSEGKDIFCYYLRFVENTPYTKYMKIRIANLQLAYNFWALQRKYKLSRENFRLILRVDFVHEFGYFLVSLLPSNIKILIMKIVYKASEN